MAASDRLAQHRALVTGASSGIGEQMARQLAAMGCDLVIAARRLDRLETLASELASQHGVSVLPVQADLAEPGTPASLYERATADGPLDICINNAGFGVFRELTEIPLEQQLGMVQVNTTALVELSHRFVVDARGRDRRAYLLNVASTAAFQPVPYFATYAATKHFVLAFSEALALELRGSNVSVTCLCPGGTWTEFFDTSEQKLGTVAKASMLPADKVARIGLNKMLRRRISTVTGWMNKLGAFLTRFGPRSLNARMAARLAGKR